MIKQIILCNIASSVFLVVLIWHFVDQIEWISSWLGEIVDKIFQLEISLTLISNFLIDDDLWLHELEESFTISFWRNSRNLSTIILQWLEFVFTKLFPVEVLEVINDAEMINVLSIVTHEGVSWFSV